MYRILGVYATSHDICGDVFLLVAPEDIFQAVGFVRVESCPTQAVLPLVGLAADKIIRDRYESACDGNSRHGPSREHYGWLRRVPRRNPRGRFRAFPQVENTPSPRAFWKGMENIDKRLKKLAGPSGTFAGKSEIN
ncbi:MAG: hypothetical protein R6U98_36160 [Pirellulaceae bacterium]